MTSENERLTRRCKISRQDLDPLPLYLLEKMPPLWTTLDLSPLAETYVGASSLCCFRAFLCIGNLHVCNDGYNVRVRWLIVDVCAWPTKIPRCGHNSEGSSLLCVRSGWMPRIERPGAKCSPDAGSGTQHAVAQPANCECHTTFWWTQCWELKHAEHTLTGALLFARSINNQDVLSTYRSLG